ncbi:MAG: glutamate 5-kinase [Dehalococcoidia bacterium]|nr:glutamate 5-kinase [Dehalococcoidia bacterium]
MREDKNTSTRPYRRVVVKLGTTLITDGTNRLDLETMASIVGQIARLQSSGSEMLLVSSGAVAAGRHVLDPTGEIGNVLMRQALAAIGQGRLMNSYEQLFLWYDVHVAQTLLTRRDLSDRMGYLNIRNTLLGLIKYRVVPIINENDVVSVDELDGEIIGDNDTLSAMVANIVDADLLIILGKTEGLFTGDPNLDSDARLIHRVASFTDEIESLGGPSFDSRGRGGMTAKLNAARLATTSGVDTIFASGTIANVVPRLVDGESLGTYFPTGASRMESRKRYMLSQIRESDVIVVDPGAVRALVRGNKSLLPAGIVDTHGDFKRGDVVLVEDTGKNRIACGISGYSSHDVHKIRRLRSDLISRTLGFHYGDEVIHRDNLVLLATSDSAQSKLPSNRS